MNCGLPLPNTEPYAHTNRRHLISRGFPIRFTKICVFFIIVLLAFVWLLDSNDLIEPALVQVGWSDPPLPPLYGQYHRQELQLPQHNPDLPYPEGREGKYVFFADHPEGSGWGNALQELLFDAHIAYKTGRSFVFDNYTWTRDGSEYSDYNGRLIPSQIPLSVLLAGPTAGGPFPLDDSAPRAVAKDYFDQVCADRKIMSSFEVSDQYPSTVSGAVKLQGWIDKLNSMPERCIEVDKNTWQAIGIWLFGSYRILDSWPSISVSPILTHFRWSRFIHSAFDKNFRLFASKSAVPRPSFDSPDPYATISGLLALHIRRGDYEQHCVNLASWGALWNGFNAFPEFIDKFDAPEGSGSDNATQEAIQYYVKRCYPSIEQIVEKVEAVRKTEAGKGLKDIYVMTNGARPWVTELKAALRKSGKWNKISSSRDLWLNWEEKYVAQAVDMMIGQRAQVIIGNGWSSLTSNIAMFRMAKHLPPDSNRFW